MIALSVAGSRLVGPEEQTLHRCARRQQDWGAPSSPRREEPWQGASTRSSTSSAPATQSWEEAAKTAVEEAAGHLEDLRVAEVVQLDMHIVENKVVAYRAKVNVSFKYHKDA